MARLFRPTYKSIDPRTGKLFEHRSDKWYADYNDADGKRRRVPLSTDKDSAQSQLAEILRTVERQKAGLVEIIADTLQQRVTTSVDEYREHLEGKGRDNKHVSETIRHIRNTLRGAGCVILGDLQRGEACVDKYLASRRKSGVSHRTINADLTAIRSFCRWLIQKKRLTVDPTIHMERLDESVDRRKQRRPLTEEEAQLLFKTTLESDHVFRGLAGRDRAMLYMLALRSGLRRSELLSLTPQSFQLHGDAPTVRVKPGDSKHRHEDLLPLPAEVATELLAYLKGKHRTKPVWPGTWWNRSAEMFRADLAAAKISILDADGRVLDFHGQRNTFITGLARAGVSPTKAQKLARHSDVNLTMRTYTHLQVEELVSAVESLPSLLGSETSRKKDAGREAPVEDPEMRRVIEAWPTLSNQVRKAIAAMIVPPSPDKGE
jgi:site-specific recombinase XerD